MIELFDDMVIAIDQYNYSLAHRRIVKDKKGNDVERFDYVSHHTSLAQALLGFRRYLVRQKLQNGLYTLSTALHSVLEIDKQIEEFILSNIPDGYLSTSHTDDAIRDIRSGRGLRPIDLDENIIGSGITLE